MPFLYGKWKIIINDEKCIHQFGILLYSITFCRFYDRWKRIIKINSAFIVYSIIKRKKKSHYFAWTSEIEVDFYFFFHLLVFFYSNVTVYIWLSLLITYVHNFTLKINSFKINRNYWFYFLVDSIDKMSGFFFDGQISFMCSKRVLNGKEQENIINPLWKSIDAITKWNNNT